MSEHVYEQGRLNLPFVGHSTFAKQSVCLDWENIEADVAVLGAPFDMGAQYRAGARFGPRAIREAGSRVRQVAEHRRLVGDERDAIAAYAASVAGRRSASTHASGSSAISTSFSRPRTACAAISRRPCAVTLTLLGSCSTATRGVAAAVARISGNI